jgi:RHS repeat-associated protein
VLQAIKAGETITQIYGINLRCKNLYVDDIILSGGSIQKVYQVTPGAATGQYLGQQAGVGGTKTYFHYNEMGTVLTTTNSTGARVGVWEPDFYGKSYFLIAGSGSRPDIGHTSKFWDSDAGMYYFNKRWYDSDRGRFVSRDPAGFISGENLYAFAGNNPTLSVDPTGLYNESPGPAAQAFGNKPSAQPSPTPKPWEYRSSGKNMQVGLQTIAVGTAADFGGWVTFKASQPGKWGYSLLFLYF